MGKPKFTDLELKRLVKQGLSCSEIAKRLNVSKGAVSMRLKAMNAAITKDVALRNAGEIVRKELDTIGQLQKINNSVNKVLEEAEAAQFVNAQQIREMVVCVENCLPKGEEDGKDAKLALQTLSKLAFDSYPKELVIKATKEIRGQLKLQLDIFQALHDMKAVAEFQEEVLNAIGSVEPEIRDRIRRNLYERRAIRSTLELY